MLILSPIGTSADSPANYTLDSAANYVFKAMSGVPVEGVVFRFIPRSGTTGLKNDLWPINTISFYPNPVKEGMLFLNIRATYEMVDLTGKVMLQVYDADQADVSQLPCGMYFLKRSDGHTRRFLIE